MSSYFQRDCRQGFAPNSFAYSGTKRTPTRNLQSCTTVQHTQTTSTQRLLTNFPLFHPAASQTWDVCHVIVLVNEKKNQWKRLFHSSQFIYKRSFCLSLSTNRKKKQKFSLKQIERKRCRNLVPNISTASPLTHNQARLHTFTPVTSPIWIVCFFSCVSNAVSLPWAGTNLTHSSNPPTTVNDTLDYNAVVSRLRGQGGVRYRECVFVCTWTIVFTFTTASGFGIV